MRDARARILEDLLSVYDACWAPFQRARVLITALSVVWRDGESEADASARFDVDRMGQEALELLTQKVSATSRFWFRLCAVLIQTIIPTDVLLGRHESRCPIESDGTYVAGIARISSVARGGRDDECCWDAR